MEPQTCSYPSCKEEFTRAFTCGKCSWSKIFCAKHAPDKSSNCFCDKFNPKMTWRPGFEPQPKKKSAVSSSSVVQRISDNSDKIDESSPIGTSTSKPVKACQSSTEICPSCGLPVDAVMLHAALENLKSQNKYVLPSNNNEEPIYPTKSEFEKTKQKMGSAKAHCIVGQTELRKGARELLKSFLTKCPLENDKAKWVLDNWGEFRRFYVEGMMKRCAPVLSDQQKIVDFVKGHEKKVDLGVLEKEISMMESHWKKQPVVLTEIPLQGSAPLLDLLLNGLNLSNQDAQKAIKTGKIRIDGIQVSCSAKAIDYKRFVVHYEKSVVSLYYDGEEIRKFSPANGEFKLTNRIHASKTESATVKCAEVGSTLVSPSSSTSTKMEVPDENADEEGDDGSSVSNSNTTSDFAERVFSGITRVPFTKGKQCHYCEELQSDFNLLERVALFKLHLVPKEFVGIKMQSELEKVSEDDFVRRWLEDEIAEQLEMNIRELTGNKK